MLKNAVLLYGDGTATFATLHPVVSRGEDEHTSSRPRAVVDHSLPEDAAEGPGTHMQAEVLPDNVLARTPDMIAWWTPSSRELMFFGGGTGCSPVERRYTRIRLWFSRRRAVNCSCAPWRGTSAPGPYCPEDGAILQRR